jgi:hypothetical protein
MTDLYKVCPDCKAEYLPHIEQCADCGAVLTLPGQPAPPAPPQAAAPASPHGELVSVRVADLDWARRLGARLERAGIDHLLEAEETAGGKCCGTGRFRILVRRDDAQAAMRVDAEQLREEVPEMDGCEMSAPSNDSCPACGDPAPENAIECPSCGLALMPVMAACAGCGGPLPPGVKQCPGCGRTVDSGCC